MSEGERFPETKYGFFVQVGDAQLCRYSSAVRKLREMGTPAEKLKEFDADRERYGSACNVHGVLTDPVIGIIDSEEGPRIAFACPFCSGGEVLAAWKREATTILA